MIDLDTQKKMAEISKLHAEKYKTLCGIVAGLASTIGLVTIFIYCFFIAHFFPTGLKAGDTLFFIFATLGMSLTGMLLSGFGMMAYFPWVNRLPLLPVMLPPASGAVAALAAQKRKENLLLLGLGSITLLQTLCVRALAFKWAGLPIDLYVEPCYVYVAIAAMTAFYVWGAYCLIRSTKVVFISVIPGLLFALVGGAICVFLPDFQGALVFFVGLLLGGFSVVLGLDLLSFPLPETAQELENSRRAKKVAGLLIFVGILIPFIACGLNARILGYVMTNLGVYTEHATLIVNKAELGKLQTVADSKGIRLYACRIDDDNAAISDVRIWWHGIGERSYVELNAYPPGDKGNSTWSAGTRVELDSGEVRKSESQKNASCIELRRGIYFDSNKTALTPDQLKLAQPILTEFLKAKKTDDSIVLVGYADPRPSATDSNSKLARNRACSVYRHLEGRPEGHAQKVLIDIRGDMEAITACSSKDGLLRESACEERNRRVEVRLIGSGGNEVVRSATANAADLCK